MASVVIVHAAEDAPPARALAEKLRQAGMQPRLEQTGTTFRNAAREAGAVVALWSPRSVAQPGLLDDVRFARSLAPVIHARMQNAPTPDEFAGDASIDLTGWRGEDDFAAWRALAGAVSQRLGVAAPPPQRTRQSGGSPFFQPGAPAPQPAAAGAGPAVAPIPRPVPRPTPVRAAPKPPPPPAPVLDEPDDEPAPVYRPEAYTRPPPDEPERSGGGRLVLVGLVTFIVVAALGGGGFFAYSQMQGSQAQAATWEHLDKTDPGALRVFIDHSTGSLHDQAQTTLTTLEQIRYAAARRADTIEAYNAFVNAFPHSDHALEARGRIAELQSAPATTTAIDPLTGMPTVPQDPDLVPPGSVDTTAATTTATTIAPQGPGGPVALTPPSDSQNN